MRVHVRPSHGAMNLRALLKAYGITGIVVRICGSEVGCYVVTDDQRNLPRD